MKHNSYFDGKVQSLGLTTEEGPATVGVIAPGKYNFSTGTEEKMVVIAGILKAKLPGKDWQSFGKNEMFIVPEKSSFDVEASGDVAYICFYK